MVKGQAQRRRAKNFLEAKVGCNFRHCLTCQHLAKCAFLDPKPVQETKSGRLLRLPPPPDAISKKGKRHSDVSRSLQRMLELKVISIHPRDLLLCYAQAEQCATRAWVLSTECACFAVCRQ